MVKRGGRKKEGSKGTKRIWCAKQIEFRTDLTSGLRTNKVKRRKQAKPKKVGQNQYYREY